MGKVSRRGRAKKPPPGGEAGEDDGEAAPAPVELSKSRKSAMLHASASDLTPRPPVAWASFEQAVVKLTQLGFYDVRLVPTYTSSELCARVATLAGVRVLDRTARVATGCGQDSDRFNVSEMFREFERSDFSAPFVHAALVLRTTENTPSFLGGLFFHMLEKSQSFKEARDKLEDLAGTPGVFVFFGKRHLCLPSHIAASRNCELTALFLAAMIQETQVPCAVCATPLLLHSKERGAVELGPAAAGIQCSHAMCKDCFAAMWLGDSRCPRCDVKLLG